MEERRTVGWCRPRTATSGRGLHRRDQEHGTIYRFAPSGAYSTRFNFDSPGGAAPMITLLQHTTGTLYGDTNVGGTHNTGVFYSFKSGLTAYAALLPTSGRVGKTIDVLGQGFNGATAVSFNGKAGPFTIVSDTYLTATVRLAQRQGW